MRILWIEHRTSRFLDWSRLQSGALPTELNPHSMEPTAGVEPAIFWLEVKRVNHYATQALCCVFCVASIQASYSLDAGTQLWWNTDRSKSIELYDSLCIISEFSHTPDMHHTTFTNRLILVARFPVVTAADYLLWEPHLRHSCGSYW